MTEPSTMPCRSMPPPSSASAAPLWRSDMAAAGQPRRFWSFSLMSCTVSKKPTSISKGFSPEHTKLTSMSS